MSIALTLNLDLIIVGATASAMFLLGFTALVTNRKSRTTRAFFLLTLAGALWSIANYFFYHVEDSALAFLIIKLVIGIAVWFVLFLFQFFLVFPRTTFTFPQWYRFGVIPLTIAVSVITLTPLVFQQVTATNSAGTITGIQNGPGIFLFFGFVIFFVFAGLFVFIHKMYHAGKEAILFRPVLWGFFITFVFLIVGNLILPAFFDISRFIPLGPVFILPMVVSAAYSIRVNHLFNVKIFTTTMLVFILSTAALFELIGSRTLSQIVLQSSLFLLVLAIGVSLIRSVEKEVEQREHIEKLAEELETTNERQEGLIHFIGHEVKGFLTKAEGAFSELSEGDFGALSETAKPFVSQALEETRNGVTSVSDILKASNQKKGTVTYHKADFDFRQLVEETAEKERPMAKRKGLELSVTADGNDFSYFGDRTELGDHVLRNLLENAIYYTPHGSIAVSLSESSGEISLSITDTGIGITEEDMRHLFTEGGHGKDSQRINANSTGYGLYIAQNTVAAHGGTIEAKSDGQGKGTTFTVRLPRMQSV